MTDKTHPGYKYICHLIDDFVQKGPNGSHVCLIFEADWGDIEDLPKMAQRSNANIIMRNFTARLLMALDYTHDSGIVHTGLLLGFPHYFLGFDFPQTSSPTTSSSSSDIDP